MSASDTPHAPHGARRSPAHALARPRSTTLDALGAAASCACAAHCLLLPAAAAMLPALGLGRLVGEQTEWALLGVTLLIGASSLGPAARRSGRTARGGVPVVLFAAGGAVLVGTRLGVLGDGIEGGAHERALVLIGAALVAAAHAINWWRVRRCATRVAPLHVVGTRRRAPAPHSDGSRIG